MKRIPLLLLLIVPLRLAAQEPDAYELADNYYSEGRYADAITMSLSALEEEPEDVVAVEFWSTLGASYARLGDYDHAAEYMGKCYQYDKENGEIKGLTSSLVSLASVYILAGSPQTAERYALEAIENELSVGRPLKLAMAYGKACDVYHALAEVARKQGQDEKARAQEETALQYAGKAVIEATSDENAVAVRRTQRALPLAALERFDEAAADLDFAIEVFRRTGNRQSLAIAAFQMAQCRKDSKALEYCREAYEAATEVRDMSLLQKICKELSILLLDSDPKEAYRYLEEYATIQLSIEEGRSDNRLELFSVEAGMAERNLTIEQLKQTNLQQHYKILYLVFTIVLLAAMAAIIYRLYRKYRRANALKNMLFSIVSHDLRSPAVAQFTALQMLNNNVGSLSAEDLKGICRELEYQAATEVELIENVLRWAKAKAASSGIQAVDFNLTEAARDTIRLFTSPVAQKKIEVTLDSFPQVLLHSDRDIVILIIRNLLSNAVKFSHQGGNVVIKITGSNTGATFSITDYGIGMSPEVLAHIFDLEKRSSRKGTQGEPGSGLGLVVCHELVGKLGGTITVESREGESTCFTVTLPNIID